MLTHEDMIALIPYERHLRNAYRSDFIINPGREGVRVMAAIYKRATNDPTKFDPTCGRCILNLLKRLGGLYFEQKAKDEAKVSKTAKVKRNRRKTAKG